MKLTQRTRDGHSPSKRTPVGSALAIPLVYVVVATAYIFLSGRLATLLARDAQQLATIESIKGYAFVLVTGGLLFVLCFLWRRTLQQQTRLLVQSERKSVAGMASASVAHDLTNLLMALSGLLEGLKGQEQGNAFLISMREQLERNMHELSDLSQRLVRASRQLEPDQEQEVELSDRIHLIAKLLKKHPDVSMCTLNLQHLEPVSLRLHATLFEQAVLNLIINAAQAARPNGEVQVSLQDSDGTILLTVADNGPGIEPKEHERIFAPGYTTKTTGSGLGLLCVRAFADSCRGKISIAPSELGGTAFQLQIPAKCKDT